MFSSLCDDCGQCLDCLDTLMRQMSEGKLQAHLKRGVEILEYKKKRVPMQPQDCDRGMKSGAKRRFKRWVIKKTGFPFELRAQLTINEVFKPRAIAGQHEGNQGRSGQMRKPVPNVVAE